MQHLFASPVQSDTNKSDLYVDHFNKWMLRKKKRNHYFEQLQRKCLFTAWSMPLCTRPQIKSDYFQSKEANHPEIISRKISIFQPKTRSTLTSTTNPKTKQVRKCVNISTRRIRCFVLIEILYVFASLFKFLLWTKRKSRISIIFCFERYLSFLCKLINLCLYAVM